MIPDDEVERVRESADIVGIIGEYVTLRRVGSTFRGPCPFHQGKHRNFSVDARRKIFKCFVCGEGGDVFTFLQKRLGVDWPSAVRMTAEKMGIELHEVHSRREGPDPREAFWEVNGVAEEFFRRMLWEEQGGSTARDYLAQREISREVADRFGLGFAPADPGQLRAHLSAMGFDEDRQLNAGMLVRREEGGDPRPRFRGRLMFPIYDATNRVAGFGGRLLGPGEPKYLNSADSPAFTKGKLLYGMNWARNAIRRAERALLVEGYFDLVRLSAAGIEEVVAPLGTALTSEQAELVSRLTKNVFLLYDSDKAGLKATFRAGEELLRQGAAVRVVSLPPGEDPDTYVRAQGREALERQVQQAVDVFERKIQLLQRGGWFADLHRRRRALDHLLPTIRAARDPLTRDMYIGRAAEASGVDRRLLSEESEQSDHAPRAAAGVRRRRAGLPGGPVVEATPARRVSRSTARVAGAGGSAERELVRAMVSSRAALERIGERIGPDQFRDARYREIFEVLMGLVPDATNADLAAALSDEATLVFEALLAEPDAILDVERTVRDCLAQLELRTLQEKNARIQRLLSAATEQEKDQLVQEKQANADEIRRLTQSKQVT